MKKPVSKEEIVRAELRRETERFLSGGGEVAGFRRVSAGKNPDDAPLFLNRRLFTEPPLPRISRPGSHSGH